MKLYYSSFLIAFIFASTIHSMDRYKTSYDEIPNEGKSICAFGPGKVIVEKKSIPCKVKRDPKNPRKFLRAPGPLTQLCLYNYTTKISEPLENSHEIYFSPYCSAKGTYFAALTPIPSQYSNDDKYIPNSENILKVWNLKTKKLIFQCATSNLSFKMSPQENYIVFESPNAANIVIRFLANGNLAYLLKKQDPPQFHHCLHGSVTGHPCPLLPDSIAFSPDDQFIAVEEHRKIQVRDLQNPQKTFAIVEGYAPQFNYKAYTPQLKGGGDLLTAKMCSTVFEYDLRHFITDLKSGENTLHLLRTYYERRY